MNTLADFREAVARASGEHKDVPIAVGSGRVRVTAQDQDILSRVLGGCGCD